MEFAGVFGRGVQLREEFRIGLLMVGPSVSVPFPPLSFVFFLSDDRAGQIHCRTAWIRNKHLFFKEREWSCRFCVCVCVCVCIQYV